MWCEFPSPQKVKKSEFWATVVIIGSISVPENENPLFACSVAVRSACEVISFIFLDEKNKKIQNLTYVALKNQILYF